MPAGDLGLAEPAGPPRVVLITGVTRLLGTQLAGRLAADPSIERVIGVDTVTPGPDAVRRLGRTELVRADIRNPLIARVVASGNVDTVVHLGVVAAPLGTGGRAAMKEVNIIGTMQLLAACQQAPAVRRLVVRSSTGVYGSSPRDPALFTEQTEPRSAPRSGCGKDAVEIEGYVRGFGRRRPDVALSVLRITNLLGAGAETPLGRYLALPVVPTVLGFDPRLQLCHVDDATEVLRRFAIGDHPGTYNVGGVGVLLLSQALRRLGRPSFPVPPAAVSLVAQLLRRGGLVEFSPEQLRLCEHGLVADVTRLRARLGWAPRPTAQVLEAVATDGSPRRVVSPERAAGVEHRVLELVGGRRHREPAGA